MRRAVASCVAVGWLAQGFMVLASIACIANKRSPCPLWWMWLLCVPAPPSRPEPRLRVTVVLRPYRFPTLIIVCALELRRSRRRELEALTSSLSGKLVPRPDAHLSPRVPDQPASPRLPRTESAWIQKRRAKIAARPQQHDEDQDHEDRLLEQGTPIAAEEEPQEPPSPTAATVVPTFSTERPLPSSEAATAVAKDEEESLRSVLKSAFLSRHEKALRGLGCAAPKDLHSLSDEQLARAGLRPIEVIRLRRLLHRVRMRSPRSVPVPRPAAQPLK